MRTTIQKSILSFFIVIILWGIFSWPLPKYFKQGIPSSSQNIERYSKRFMIAGDHLQFLYRFWLFKDMMLRNTKAGYNLYEFNQGDDKKCKNPGFYYFPFSFIFAVGSFFGSLALGYNFNGFITLWLTLLFTWLLLKGYKINNYLALLASLVSVTLPYRWVTFLGGSPTGLSMVFIPMVFYGIDRAIKNRSYLKSFLAGIAVLFAYFTDAHVFFFTFVSLPFFILIACLSSNNFKFSHYKSYIQALISLIPAILLSALALFLSLNKHSDLSDSLMAGGRTLREVLLYSPQLKGVFLSTIGLSNLIYIGVFAFILIFAGGYYLLKRNDFQFRKNVIIYIILLSGLLIIITLSLGARSPFNALPFRIIRKLIPPYAMIRQPAKIFCLVPTLLAFLMALSLESCIFFIKQKRLKIIFTIFVISIIIFQFKSQIKASISLLPETQNAYKAISLDADKNNIQKRALAVPLWPGDSAWSSLYQYYSSLYRIKMLNGYRPVVSKDYFNNVFRRYETVNKGILSDIIMDEFLKMGIGYLIFHEDAFPEKVSSFSVFLTLKRLLNHQRLSLLKQEESVWTFKILDSKKLKETFFPDLNTYISPKHYELERCPHLEAETREDMTASYDRYLKFKSSKASVTSQSFHTYYVTDNSFFLRARGKGDLNANIFFGEGIIKTIKVLIDSENWQWFKIEAGKLEGYHPLKIEFSLLSGECDLDYIYFGTLKSDNNIINQNITFPAPLFFHAGFTNIQNKSVMLLKNKVFSPDIDLTKKNIEKLKGNQYAVLYGPELPFASGKYLVNLEFRTKSEYGTLLGSYHVRVGSNIKGFKQICAGMETQLEIEITNNLPVTVDFIFANNEDIEITNITFKVVEKLENDYKNKNINKTQISAD